MFHLDGRHGSQCPGIQETGEKLSADNSSADELKENLFEKEELSLDLIYNADGC